MSRSLLTQDHSQAVDRRARPAGSNRTRDCQDELRYWTKLVFNLKLGGSC
jgi:hypothetical protein